jgi:hypothetical protein
MSRGDYGAITFVNGIRLAPRVRVHRSDPLDPNIIYGGKLTR